MVVESVHQVPVAVHGHSYGAVAESGLDGLGVLTSGDEPGGVGVAQVVDPTRRTYGFGDSFAPDPSEGAECRLLAERNARDHALRRAFCGGFLTEDCQPSRVRFLWGSLDL